MGHRSPSEQSGVRRRGLFAFGEALAAGVRTEVVAVVKMAGKSSGWPIQTCPARLRIAGIAGGKPDVEDLGSLEWRSVDSASDLNGLSAVPVVQVQGIPVKFGDCD
jgi:hypothetical protein